MVHTPELSISSTETSAKCNVGRRALYLQQNGRDVVGVDIPPLALEQRDRVFCDAQERFRSLDFLVRSVSSIQS